MSSIVRPSVEQEYGYTMRSIRLPFKKKFPTVAGAGLGVLQMLLNGAIVGLESGSVAYNPTRGIVYAGFWCSFAFFFTWVGMYAFLCFRKTIRWGLVVAGLNLVSIGFAIILIVFDALIITNPCRCFLATVCNIDGQNETTCPNSDGKLRMVKSQLACVVTMLATNLVYIILFMVIFFLTRISYKPLAPSFQPLSSSGNSSPKPIIHPLQSSSAYPYAQTLTYPPRYEQTMYPEQQHVSWRSPLYFNGDQKF